MRTANGQIYITELFGSIWFMGRMGSNPQAKILPADSSGDGGPQSIGHKFKEWYSS
jgi:hypothetical protein